MNRLLGQQPKLNTNTTSSPRPPSTDSSSTRSPMSASGTKDHPNIVRARSPSLEPSNKRGHSPHIANQSLSPTVPRKPVENSSNRDRNNTTIPSSSDTTTTNNNSPTPNPNLSSEQKYQFDTSPSPSTRNSMMPASGSLEMDPQVKLEDYDWAELEEQFAKRMEAFRAEEDGIWEEWKGWGEIFKAWASTISVHDEERASKRLRTRIAFTQGSEESLEAKRQHYIKVVQAFESALALLGSRNSAHNFI